MAVTAALLSPLIVGASLAGCDSRAPAVRHPSTVTVGVLADGAGGDLADLDAVRGAALAADLVNRSQPRVPIPLAAADGLPGLGGARLIIEARDTKGAAEQAATAANELVTTVGATAVVISESADVTAAAGSQTQRQGVALVDAGSSADYLTELGMDWYFRTVPTDRMLAEVAFALLRRQLTGTARPALALLADASGQSAATAVLVRDLASRAGYPVAVDHTDVAGPASVPSPPALAAASLAELSPADVDARARQISDGACHVILAMANTSPAAAGVARIASRLTAPMPVVGLGPGFAAMTEPVPDTPTILRTTSWSAELASRSPVGKAVTELYQRLFGTPMTAVAANTFTATLVVAMAIDAAGSVEPAAIRSALRRLNLSATQMIMPWNGVRFDADGQNQLAAGVIEGLDLSGFRVIYPRELATGPMIWAVPEAASG